MAEWVIETGIGERRAALIANGQIVAAHVARDSDGLRAGAVFDARLIDQRQRLARTDSGEEVYLARLPTLTEGSSFRALVQRPALAERDLVKRASAVPVDPEMPLSAGPDLNAIAAATGYPVVNAEFQSRRLDDAGWGELLDEAATGIIPFAEGLLRICLTPAMTVVDVDSAASGTPVAIGALAALASALRRHGIGGNVVVDLPTLPHVAARKTVAEVFDAAMQANGLHCERTAINGFGLLQIILPRRAPSLLERVHYAPVETAALALLRRAERAVGTGPMTLVAHPAVSGWIEARPELLTELTRRIGRPIILQAEPARSMDAGHAQ